MGCPQIPDVPVQDGVSTGTVFEDICHFELRKNADNALELSRGNSQNGSRDWSKIQDLASKLCRHCQQRGVGCFPCRFLNCSLT
jgi:hypothetical protein